MRRSASSVGASRSAQLTSEQHSQAPTVFNPDPARVRKVFAEFREAAAIDARERRYSEPEPPPGESVGRI